MDEAAAPASAGSTWLVPWAPEEGARIEAGWESSEEDAASRVDIEVEGEWIPHQPVAPMPSVVNIVDGVQRTDAHALTETGGAVVPSLFGSYAAGVVRCEGGRARVLTDEALLRVERCHIQAGQAPASFEVPIRSTPLIYRGVAAEMDATPAKLGELLTRQMLNAGAALTESLSRDGDALTLVDGLLHAPPTGRRVAGYVKRTARWHLPADARGLLMEMPVGARTPLFRITGGSGAEPRAGRDRYACFVRMADLGPHVHPLSTVMRVEMPASLPLDEAVDLANECTVALPRFASSPVHDARAPQNLTPVRGLERALRRRLGDAAWLRRRIAVTVGTRHSPVA